MPRTLNVNTKETYPWIILLMLSLQLGISEFLSVQFILFLVLLIHAIKRKKILQPKIILFFSSLILIYSIGLIFDGHELHRYLVCIRTALCASLAFSFTLKIKSKENPNKLKFRLLNTLEIFGILCLILAFFQLIDTIYVRSGIFYIPSELYALDYGTLSSAQKFDLLFLRPSGPFSEPSALAMNGLMLYCIAIIHQNKKLLTIGLLMTFVSMSLTGYIFIFLSTYYYLCGCIGIFAHRRNRAYFLLFSLVLVLFSAYILSGRIERVLSGDDLSSLIRIFEPINVISSNFKHGLYFGASQNLLTANLDKGISSIFDNWIFNQFLYFGLLAIPILLTILLSYPSLGAPFVIALGFANGDMFYYDRVVMLALFFYCISMPRNSKMPPANSANY